MDINGLLWWLSGREFAFQCRSLRRCVVDPWVRKSPCRRAWQPTPVFLPGESHEQRSLVGCNLWGCKELFMTEVTQHACTLRQGLRGLVVAKEVD